MRRLFTNHEKEICFDKIPSQSTRRCGKGFNNDPLKYQCYERSAESEFVHTIESMLSVTVSSTSLMSSVFITFIFLVLLRKEANKTDGYNKIIKLERVLFKK